MKSPHHHTSTAGSIAEDPTAATRQRTKKGARPALRATAQRRALRRGWPGEHTHSARGVCVFVMGRRRRRGVLSSEEKGTNNHNDDEDRSRPTVPPRPPPMAGPRKRRRQRQPDQQQQQHQQQQQQRRHPASHTVGTARQNFQRRGNRNNRHNNEEVADDDDDDIVAQLRRQRLRQQQQKQQQEQPGQAKGSATVPTTGPPTPPPAQLGQFHRCDACNAYFLAGAHPPHSASDDGPLIASGGDSPAARFRNSPWMPLVGPIRETRGSTHWWLAAQICSGGVPYHQRRRIIEAWRGRLLFGACSARPSFGELRVLWEEERRGDDGRFAVDDPTVRNIESSATGMQPPWCRTFDVAEADATRLDDHSHLHRGRRGTCSAKSTTTKPVVVVAPLSGDGASLIGPATTSATERDYLMRNLHAPAGFRVATVRLVPGGGGDDGFGVGLLGNVDDGSAFYHWIRPFRQPTGIQMSPQRALVVPFDREPIVRWNDFACGVAGRRLILVGDATRSGRRTHPSQGPWLCDATAGQVVHCRPRRFVGGECPASDALCVEWFDDGCGSANDGDDTATSGNGDSVVVGHRNGQCSVWDIRAPNCVAVLSAKERARATTPLPLGNVVRLRPLPGGQRQVVVRGNGSSVCQMWDVRYPRNPVWDVPLERSTRGWGGSTFEVENGPTRRSTGLAIDPSSTIVLAPVVVGDAGRGVGGELTPLLAAWSLTTGAFVGAKSLLPADRTATNRVSVELCDRRTVGWTCMNGADADSHNGANSGGGAVAMVRRHGTWGLCYRLFGCPVTTIDTDSDGALAPPASHAPNSLHHVALHG